MLEASCWTEALRVRQSDDLCEVRPGRPTDLLESPNPRFCGDAACFSSCAQSSVITPAAAFPAGVSTHPSVSPCPPLSPGLQAQRVLVMMAFLDGIKLSLPAAVSHANYIVCRVDGSQTPTVSFFGFFLFFIFFAMPFSVALLRLPLMLVFNVCLRQVYRHSYMASYSIYNIHTR